LTKVEYKPELSKYYLEKMFLY